eukprot:792015-Rhodomonas_salina.1
MHPILFYTSLSLFAYQVPYPYPLNYCLPKTPYSLAWYNFIGDRKRRDFLQFQDGKYLGTLVPGGVLVTPQLPGGINVQKSEMSKQLLFDFRGTVNDSQ